MKASILEHVSHWGRRLVIAPIRIYQWLISPMLGPQCRYQPTCSEYLIQAVQKHGIMFGMWKGIRRICRCHPWGPGGYDPP